ncbi:MAG TPA: valine--tRNA ligase [Methanomicrobiales archaeon]|nr:valine--tRNA ligase [Methanomicrobiales archaeon]
MNSSGDIPRHYDFAEVEGRWQRTWRDEENYFDRRSGKPRYVIDTPPPYPTGNFHIGNALNWCYIDFIARYKRMQGYNVMFPQGWDCHGLPTEVKVEEIHGITKNDVSREEFRRMCRELTEKNIGLMRATLRRLGFSIDWSNEYITMRPEYFGRTQKSFLRMFYDGYIYQAEHPVNFCIRCETAIAFAEVTYQERETTLTTFLFDGVEIATTRPELLAACVAVAVHPEDERFARLHGRELTVPFFGQKVPVHRDTAVDPTFGTGAVMICTFGDKQDVHWWKQYNLPLRKAIDRKGQMTGIAGKYAGMTVAEARKAIVADMKKAGLLRAEKKITQRVGTCWRCKTPIEILSERQWFIRVKHDEILKAAREVTWIPGHMRTRLENWVAQMEWDWCISRQRIFATPIPVWFCDSCGEMILPAEEDIPVDPTLTRPKVPCPKCGGTKFTPEEDVLDTWMDSSISVLNVTGWTGKGIPPLFPAQLRPQGHDIIRTWACYTILRSVALTRQKPWDGILVNGMVLGEDGFKMSKSRGNIIQPEEILAKYGADSFRQWSASGAATGSDIMFNWNDVVAASRLQTKLWNIVRFILPKIGDSEHDVGRVTVLADRWLLDRLSATVSAVTSAMESYAFDTALKAIREFAWDILADQYIELAKGRLYSEEPERESAVAALAITLDALIRMLAPFLPHFAEECYHHLKGRSVHREPWVGFGFRDDPAREEGDLLARIVSGLRTYKHDRGMALNAPFGHLMIYTKTPVNDSGDGARALNAAVTWMTGEPVLEKRAGEVKFNMGVVGPAFKGRAREFMDAVRRLPSEQLQNPPASIALMGGEVAIPAGAFTPSFTYALEGRNVDVVTVGDAIVAVERAP